MSGIVFTSDMCPLFSVDDKEAEAKVCAMAAAGVKWLRDHPHAHPNVNRCAELDDLITPGNKDAELFLAAMISAGGNKMPNEYLVNAVVHVEAIHFYGWVPYREESKRKFEMLYKKTEAFKMFDGQ